MSDNVIRTTEEIDDMIRAIDTHLQQLPDKDVWGDSNEGIKKEMRVQLKELRDYLISGKLPEDRWNEVRGWLEGKSWSFLGDYLR